MTKKSYLVNKIDQVVASEIYSDKSIRNFLEFIEKAKEATNSILATIDFHSDNPDTQITKEMIKKIGPIYFFSCTDLCEDNNLGARTYYAESKDSKDESYVVNENVFNSIFLNMIVYKDIADFAELPIPINDYYSDHAFGKHRNHFDSIVDNMSENDPYNCNDIVEFDYWLGNVLTQIHKIVDGNASNKAFNSSISYNTRGDGLEFSCYATCHYNNTISVGFAVTNLANNEIDSSCMCITREDLKTLEVFKNIKALLDEAGDQDYDLIGHLEEIVDDYYAKNRS